MKLNYDKKSKNPTYFIQMGIRNGKKTTTKNVAVIGKHNDLLKITDDPLTYAKQKVLEYNEELKNSKMELNFSVDFSEKLKFTENTASPSSSLNIGYFILQYIYNNLCLKDFFNEITKTRKITFNCNDINRFLTYARILDPKSKLGTFDDLKSYYEKPDIQYQHILRFMDVLADNYDDYISHLFHFSNNIVRRNTSVCYYDCTNFYFEIEDEDTDYIDPVTGELLKGLRKYDPSKEHRPNPIVQMGLFMDGNGIPISMSLNPGSDNEQKSAIPLEEKMVKMFKNKKFIYCADAGLSSFDIRKFNSIGNRAFIVTQSIKKLSQPLQAAVFNDFDYRLLSTNDSISLEDMKTFDRFDSQNYHLYNDKAYKIIEVENPIDIGLYEEKISANGKTKKVKSKAVLKQKIIITFSRKMMEYQRHIRNAQIQRARNLVSNGNAEKIKKGPHDVTRFIKRTSTSKTGEKAVVDTFEIDEKIIKKEEMYDGFYAIATNLEGNVKEISDINANRYKIEDCFRVLKSHFDARPAFHRLSNRLIAHFMICYTALLIYRLLEVKLNNYGEHFTTDAIINTLRNMNVINIQDICYQSIYEGSKVCTALNGVFNLGLDKKYYQGKDLNKKLKNISKQ